MCQTSFLADRLNSISIEHDSDGPHGQNIISFSDIDSVSLAFISLLPRAVTTAGVRSPLVPSAPSSKPEPCLL